MSKRFRIAFSFAGEKRNFVEGMAQILASYFEQEFILYDKFHEAEFARPDLAFYLPNLYEVESDLVVGVFCTDYTNKEWCGLEWNAIFGLLKRKNAQAVMLMRFGHVEPEGLHGLAGFIDLEDKQPIFGVSRILERLALNEGKQKDFYTCQQKYLQNSPPSPVEQHSTQEASDLQQAGQDLSELQQTIGQLLSNAPILGKHQSHGGVIYVEKLSDYNLPSASDESRLADERIEELASERPLSPLPEIGRNAKGIIGQTIIRPVCIESGDANYNNFINCGTSYEPEIYDREIEKRINLVIKKLYFREYDSLGESTKLGNEIIEDQLSNGSKAVKGNALAWCSRIQSLQGDFSLAKKFLLCAQQLIVSTDQLKIAEGFILCRQENNAKSALRAIQGLRTPAAFTAGLMFVSHHEYAQGAVDWMAKVGRTASDLDADGKRLFIIQQFDIKCWDQAAICASSISDADFVCSPSLHHLVALCKLLPAVPEELRTSILTYVPFGVKAFPLGSKNSQLKARKEAITHFIKASKIAKYYECNEAADISLEYSLWLQLVDPDNDVEREGMRRLKMKLEKPENLRYVPLALQCDILLNYENIEQVIDRCAAEIGGVMSSDAIYARIAIAFFTKKNPEQIRNYLIAYHEQLVVGDNIDLAAYTKLLASVGLFEKAWELYSKQIGQCLTTDELSTLRSTIIDAQATDPIALFEKKYNESNALADLMALVGYLLKYKRWEEGRKYAISLFEKTQNLEDAKKLVTILYQLMRAEEIVNFFREHNDLLVHSGSLKTYFAWALYYEGSVHEAEQMLSEINEQDQSPFARSTQKFLYIVTGNWDALSIYIENEYSHRAALSALELINVTQLALRLGRTERARDLLYSATDKAGDDADVWIAAYHLATSAGWEDDSIVFGWLEQAVRFSGDKGPIQKMSIKDILELQPKWMQGKSEIWDLFQKGKLPIFWTGHFFKRGLIRMMLFPMYSNYSGKDLRQKALIPVYSGKRTQTRWRLSGKIVGIDITALLTLAYIDLLESMFAAFEIVYIPHSTLLCLFNEKSEAVYHQPSLIKKASIVIKLLAAGSLEKFSSNNAASNDLVSQAGEEFAAFIAEAQALSANANGQHMVIRPAPVYNITSFMDIEVDLSAHGAVLGSCLSVVEKLKEKNVITRMQEQKASLYLGQREQPWPNQTPIADGAILYLDSLAISYFLDMGLLGKLKDAGLRGVVSSDYLAEADLLLSVEEISGDILSCIERVRLILNKEIYSGKVKLDRMNPNEHGEEHIRIHPTFGMPAIARLCDALIIDDRVLNQNNSIDSSVIITTLDLLDSMAVAELLSAEDLLEKRTKLRKSGYAFVPLALHELRQCLEQSIVDGELSESAELKAIRESILISRMTEWLQLPDEGAWLDSTLEILVDVLKSQWGDEFDLQTAEACSDWLYELINPLGWAQLIELDNLEDLYRMAYFRHFYALLDIPLACQQNKTIEAYSNWLNERILAPMKLQLPKVFAWLVDLYRQNTLQKIEICLSSESN